MSAPTEFPNVTAVAKANIYFGGKVISHAIVKDGGEKITLGVILPGSYAFDTAAPERMDVIAGACRVKLQGAADWTEYAAGTSFSIPGDSNFDIEVADEPAQYICTYG